MLTICTPTYNREKLLFDLYESLKKQTSKDFEWIIIDDGSTDCTGQKVKVWIEKEKDFPIRYIKKENGGKHTAVNIGIELAAGDYFMIVDSDDFLTNDAVEIIHHEFIKLLPGQFAGIGFNKIFENGDIVGKTFAGEFVDATNFERSKFGIQGDKAEVFFVNVINQYRFPVFKEEHFLTEAIVWNRIAHDGFKFRWINKGVYVCRYQPDGLSMSSGTLKSYNGYSLYIKELMKYKELPFVDKIKWLGVYSYICHKNGISDKKTSEKIDTSLSLVLMSRMLYMVKSRGTKNARKEKLRIK